MDSKRVIIWLMLIIISVGSVLNNGVTAATYNVGDDIGWTVPPLGDVAYKTWARKQDFAIGDQIVFTWNRTHTVAQLSSQSDYDNCNTVNVIGSTQTISPFTFTINSTDSHYFICTVDSHCKLGQKVTITVGSGSSAASATSIALSATLFAMAAVFYLLYYIN